MDLEMGREFGCQITVIKKAINTKDSIRMIKKVGLAYIHGKMGQFMRENFSMI
jgi:hypothetical protein